MTFELNYETLIPVMRDNAIEIKRNVEVWDGLSQHDRAAMDYDIERRRLMREDALSKSESQGQFSLTSREKKTAGFYKDNA